MCSVPTLNPTISSSYGFATGTDQWVPTMKDPQWGCGGSSTIDPFHICGTTPGAVLYDDKPTTLNFPADVANTRFDYLYVVTPTSVTSNDMNNTSSSVYQTYAPYRFMSGSDCNAANPSDPASGCSTAKQLNSYGILWYSVAAPDSTLNSANVYGNFPVCALQPD
jgi:hypothetical protein